MFFKIKDPYEFYRTECLRDEEISIFILNNDNEFIIGFELADFRLGNEADFAEFIENESDFPLLGYFSYDYDLNEAYKARVFNLPSAFWGRFNRYYIGRREGISWIVESLKRNLVRHPIPKIRDKFQVNLEFYKEEDYEASVKLKDYFSNFIKIKDAIAAGDYYQINYSFYLRKKLKDDPYLVWKKYLKANPASYAAYLNFPSQKILSFSPELFLQKSGDNLVARPIKGTLAKDLPLEGLTQSKKNLAELNMITDLFRNDLYQVCSHVNVNVENKVLELKHLNHQFSEVCGQLLPGISFLDIISRTFPSGSVTGCPKRRSREQIQLYENHSRGIYTGSIGYIFKGDFVLNVAIRTALFDDGWCYFPVGSGIVYDSQVKEEWEECLLKAKPFLDLCNELSNDAAP